MNNNYKHKHIEYKIGDTILCKSTRRRGQITSISYISNIPFHYDTDLEKRYGGFYFGGFSSISLLGARMVLIEKKNNGIKL